MSKSKHTPGPWVKESDSLFVRARGCLVAEAIPQDRGEANARLIAASPDMLNALKACFKNGMVSREDWNPDNELTREMVLAAIRKAEGRNG
jgi:hypothetical protein